MKRIIFALLMLAAGHAYAQSCVTASQVTLTGNLRSANGLPSSNYTISFKPSQQGFIAGCGVNVASTFACGTSTDGSVVGLPNPLGGPTVTNGGFVSTGLPSGYYYVVYAWYDAAGHITLVSPETAYQLSGGPARLVVTGDNQPSGAVGMQVYIGTTTGGETLQGSTTGSGSYVQSSPLVSGASPVSANGTACSVTANDAVWPVGTGYVVSLTDSSGNGIPGYPMQWQLLGPGTTVNLSNGLPYYHGVVQYPVPVLTAPQNHGVQSISGNLSLDGYNLIDVGSIQFANGSNQNGVFYPPTIPEAVAAANTPNPITTALGSVAIPGNYLGTETFNSNPNGVHVDDQRPLSNTSTPIQIVNAAMFGATCNGFSNDTTAIQNAVAASYAYNALVSNREPFVIQLPSGWCTITAPIKFGIFGSLQGQGGSTFLVGNYGSWVGSDHNMIEVTYNGAVPGGNTAAPRVFGHMTVFGENNSGIPDSQAFQVINTANVYDPSGHTIGQLAFEDMAVANVDTGFDLQDSVNTKFDFVWINNVRVGANLNGDVIQTFFSNVYFQDGSAIGTSNHTTAYGLIVQGNDKYGSGCATHTMSCEPQGVFFHDSSIISFDYNVDVEWCIQCDFHDATIDVPASGITGSGADFELGGYAVAGGLWIKDSYMGAEKPNTYIINSAFSFQGGGSDGLWIERNRIFSNVSPGTTNGIVFGGSGPIAGVHVNGNQFSGLNQGIAIGQNILNSEFRGNTGNTMSSYLINLAFAGTPDGTGTVVDGNTVAATNSVAVLNEGASTNFRVGFNQSPLLVTGTFTAHGPGCTTSPASTIGGACAVTMTNPVPFPDNNYYISGCGVNGAAAGHSYISTISVPTNGGVFSVAETASDTTSTGGGQVYCTVVHP